MPSIRRNICFCLLAGRYGTGLIYEYTERFWVKSVSVEIRSVSMILRIISDIILLMKVDGWNVYAGKVVYIDVINADYRIIVSNKFCHKGQTLSIENLLLASIAALPISLNLPLSLIACINKQDISLTSNPSLL